MKQMTSPSQMAELSPLAKERLSKWLKEKDYGAEIDGEFFPAVQLSIGQMIEYLQDSIYQPLEITEYEGWKINGSFKSDELCDALFLGVKDILEQKN